MQDDERLQESGSIVEGFWRGRGWSFVEREGSQGRGGASGAGGGQPYVPPRRWLTGSFKLTICFTLCLHRDALILGSQVWFSLSLLFLLVP